MPRVANQPRGQYGAGLAQSPMKIPLNDDRQEKAIRFQSRQALQDIQINQIKAAASPMRKVSNSMTQGSPQTPNKQGGRGKENLDDETMLAVIPNNSMTPMKRVPILANFEEWMKLATDNKINATNSWNFALIDYFHDMSLLKEGDGVNFQKASCTLDGCVKIYTSRVDSVATETGKLLSGLADSTNKKKRQGEEDEDEDQSDGEDEGSQKRAKRRAQRSSEATLVTNFSQLQLKKFELEFAVDPLFKKASADFDEGGAKGLLLNHLAIDGQGRIVFDSSDDNNAQESNPSELEDAEKNLDSRDTSDVADDDTADIDLALLGSTFFPELSTLDEQDVCPSLKNFDVGDPKASLDLHLPRDSPEVDHGNDGKDQTLIQDNGEAYADDDDNNGLGFSGGLDLPIDSEFGDGGEVWARNAALHSTAKVHNTSFGDVQDGSGADGDNQIGVDESYKVSLNYGQAPDAHDNILEYFDRALSKTWAGPEHWRIKRIKDTSKVDSGTSGRRKEKEVFEIDFISPFDPASSEMIHTSASSSSAISMPKSQWKSQSRNLLPDDKHFNSKQLLRLFLKPNARIGGQRLSRANGPQRGQSVQDTEIDQAYWARDSGVNDGAISEVPANPNYDANFFQDDFSAMPAGTEDDDDFADARETFSPGLSLETHNESSDKTMNPEDTGESGPFGSHLVTQSKRLRPEYVQYARVAKKVDVRKLKEEMWKGIGLEEPFTKDDSVITSEPTQDLQEGQTLEFTSVMNGLQSVYPKQAMADISTSYCFICLLHLANEKNLKLEHDQGLEELMITKDVMSIAA